MTDLVVGRDEHSIPTYVRELSDSVAKISIGGSGNASVVVPAGKRRMIASFSPGSSVDVGINAVPATYTGAFVFSSNQDLLPYGVKVAPGDTVNILNATTDAALVALSFYEK